MGDLPDKGPQYPAYINKNDVLTSNSDLLDNLGDIEDRNQEFE